MRSPAARAISPPWPRRSNGQYPRTPLRRACTHKIAIGDSDLINVRFGSLCGLSQTFREVREVPTTGRDAERNKCAGSLFDHLVGAGEQRRWHIEAEHPGGLHVDN